MLLISLVAAEPVVTQFDSLLRDIDVTSKDSGREGPACRVISCRMERGMNYCVYAHLRQLIAISRHFWSVLKRSRHAASESHADMADAAEFNMIVSEFLTRQKAKTKNKTKQSKAKQSKAKENKSNTNKTKHLLTKQNNNNNNNKKATQTKQIICVLTRNLDLFFNQKSHWNTFVTFKPHF